MMDERLPSFISFVTHSASKILEIINKKSILKSSMDFLISSYMIKPRKKETSTSEKPKKSGV